MPTKTALYRHFNADGVLLYVGVTDDLSRRTIEHKSGSHWFDDVVHTTTEYLSSRDHALACEGVAIRFEKPLHNKCNSGTYVPSGAVESVEFVEVSSVELKAEIEIYARKCGVKPKTITRRAVGNSRLYERLKGGYGCTLRIAEQLRAYMRAHPPASQKSSTANAA